MLMFVARTRWVLDCTLFSYKETFSFSNISSSAFTSAINMGQYIMPLFSIQNFQSLVQCLPMIRCILCASCAFRQESQVQPDLLLYTLLMMATHMQDLTELLDFSHAFRIVVPSALSMSLVFIQYRPRGDSVTRMRSGYLGASFLPEDFKVRVFKTSDIVDRLSYCLYIRSIPLYGHMDRRSCYIPFSYQS